MNNLRHVAFIMDGNGRWAKERNLPRHKGHKKGVENIIDILRYCNDISIYCVSFFCFSTENWNRPKSEIDHLFSYLKSFFKKNIKELQEKKIKVHISGDISKLPEDVIETINNAIKLTENNDKMIFNICLNYGGRDEIIRAIKKLNNSNFDINNLTEDNFKDFLDTKNLPDVDLLIRTSGEERVSNFLLYELAYSEMIFNKKYWPDYDVSSFKDDLIIYNNRKRRFGGIK